MDDQIRVRVVEPAGRKHYQLQYTDPMTRRRITRGTKIEIDGKRSTRTAAEREAAKWEDELRSGRYQAPSKIQWADFRERYNEEKLSSLAEQTFRKACDVLKSVERIVNPAKLSDLTPARLSFYQAELRKQGKAETTIAGYLAYIRSALKWAFDMGLLPVVPKIQRPKRAKGGKVMKGRPITGEEFDRMLAATEGIVGAKAAPSWRFYLHGLWASGLRLAESLDLYWDRDDRLCVDMTGRRPMLRIPGECEKGNETRVLPMAPEFAQLLLSVPEGQRTGPVFNPATRTCSPRLSDTTVGAVVSKIGKRAGIKVNTDSKGKVKYASAHDLRRAFGERWAARLMPQQLMELMRHESIETTLRFYVGRNAEKTADALWAAHEADCNKNATPEPKATDSTGKAAHEAAY